MNKLNRKKVNRLSDSDILERSPKEPWLFGMLVDRYQKAFLRKSQTIVHSTDLAEDIVQETFLKIYKNAGNFNEVSDASFKSWAYKILLNTCYTYYSKQKKETAHVSYMDFTDIDNIDTDIKDETIPDRHLLIESIFSRMPKSMARLLKLYFLEGKNQKEIALIEHVSPVALRVRIHRAKKYFRDNFKDIKLEMLW